MVDLKQIIEKYPECAADTNKLRAYLNDLCNAWDDRKAVSDLIEIAESGFSSEIYEKKEISYAEYTRYVANIKRASGLDKEAVETGTKKWMDALSVKIGNSKNADEDVPADHIHKYHKTIMPPNCTQKGYTKYWCDCGYEYNADYVRPTACRYTIIEQKNPNCQQVGYIKYKCSGCGKEKQEILPITEHLWDDWTTKILPSCEKIGSRIRRCKICGATETESITALKHDFDEWHEKIHPQCESAGKIARVCKYCGNVEEKEIPSTGHRWSEWEWTEDEKTKYRFCLNCGKDEIQREIIQFGRYPQTKTGELNPIEWKILERNNNQGLIISKYALDYQKYNFNYGYTTWNTSDVRSWMNNEFLRYAFSIEEQNKIVNTNVNTKQNPKYGTNPGNTTNDKIFLLSIEEVIKYLPSDESRKCVPTSYAKERIKGISVYNKALTRINTCCWWLRTPGMNSYNVAFILNEGSINYGGKIVNSRNVAIRPALWINLDI